MFRPSKDIVKGVCGVGIPAAIQNLLNVTGMTVLNNFASAFGSDAVAAVGIAQKINMIPFQIALGSSQGIMPLVSYNYSSGNRKRMKNAILFTSAIAVSFLTAVTIGYYFGAAGLIRMFMKTRPLWITEQGFCVEYAWHFLSCASILSRWAFFRRADWEGFRWCLLYCER